MGLWQQRWRGTRFERDSWRQESIWIFLMVQMAKHLPHCSRRPGFNPWVGISWRRKWHPTSVFLPGKSHGRRNLVGYSPWSRKESDTTERLHFLSFFPGDRELGLEGQLEYICDGARRSYSKTIPRFPAQGIGE